MKWVPTLISCIVTLFLISSLSFFLTLSYINETSAKSLEVPFCSKANPPKNSLPIPNLIMAAGGVASLSVSKNFSGDHLAYSISAQPTNSLNKISINPKKGKITIKTKAKDNFDVIVSVQNPCGSASATFHVYVN